MNSAIFRSGNLHNVISLDPFAIEHTEILFGPGSTLYGSDAIGGVMVFQTLSPVFSISDGVETSGKVSLRTASANDEKTLHAHVKAGGKRWASVTSVSRFDYGDLRMGRHGDDRYLRPSYIVRENGSDVTVTNPNPLVQTPSGYKQLNLMQKLRFKASNHLDLQYGGHYSGTGNFSRYDRLTRPRGTNLRSAEFYYGPQIWGMNVLTATLTKPSALFDDAAIRVAHQYFEESRFDRDRNSVTLRERLEKVIAFSANADFRAFMADGQVLYYGAEFVTNDVRSRGVNRNIDTGVSVAGPSRYPQATWQSGAVYLRYERTLRENLLFAAGTRWNTFRMDADFSGNAAFFPLPFESARLNNQAITGSAGLFWTPLSNWSVRVSGSTGFRAPNVDDVGKIFDSTPGSVVVPNRELGAEYALNGEIGTAFTLGNVLKLDAASFYTRLNNALVRRPFTLDGRDSVLYDGVLSRVEAIQNAAFATVYGVQGSADINLGYGFSAGLAFSWQEGTEELDNGQRDPLRHAAPFSAQTRLEYRNRKVTVQLRTVQMSAVPFRDLALEERAKDWMYAKDADGNPYAPAWRVANLNTVIRINRNWNLAAGVENLFDVRYRPYSSGITAPGRNMYITATAAF
jgi:hemoglobin/transferrin/lactoferrin receptor protein